VVSAALPSSRPHPTPKARGTELARAVAAARAAITRRRPSAPLTSRRRSRPYPAPRRSATPQHGPRETSPCARATRSRRQGSGAAPPCRSSSQLQRPAHRLRAWRRGRCLTHPISPTKAPRLRSISRIRRQSRPGKGHRVRRSHRRVRPGPPRILARRTVPGRPSEPAAAAGAEALRRCLHPGRT
jgi:hypothetical protein